MRKNRLQKYPCADKYSDNMVNAIDFSDYGTC